MELEKIDWDALERLRTGFLNGSAGANDYWRDESDLASYDATFAQRIGWKWSYVLSGLARRGWTPQPGTVWDWGCGSGIAGRVFLDHFGMGPKTSLLLSDRSEMAVRYALHRAKERFPELAVRAANPAEDSFSTLLLSHVLGELSEDGLPQLLARIVKATAVVWIEPGTRLISRKLSELRDRLVSEFNAVAPCTHGSGCGMLAAGNEPHWCHHFASPPPAVFTDGNWSRFAALAGVDLRSLPLSYLVLDKRPVAPRPSGAVRVIGHPRVYKGYALLLGCDGAGVGDKRLSKRTAPEIFRQLKKDNLDTLQIWECDGNEILTTRPASRPIDLDAEHDHQNQPQDKLSISNSPMQSLTGPKRIRELLAKPGIIRSLGAHDVFTALLVEQAGFETVFIGGFGTSASMLGLPDLNFLTMTEMADAVRRMAARLTIPVIADGDTGHGDLHHVQRTVRMFESAGAAGILLEDQVAPKRCGHFADKQVIATSEMVLKIKAAVQAKSNPDFLIFARTDARQMNGLDDAIERVNLCCEAGADIAFIEAPQSRAELEEIPKRVPFPLFVNMLSGGVTPILPVNELEQLGYRIVVCPIESLLVCARAMRELCETWKTEGRVDHLAAKAMSFAEIKEVLQVREFLDLKQRLG